MVYHPTGGISRSNPGSAPRLESPQLNAGRSADNRHIVARLLGRVVHPDAALLPLLASIVPLGLGALLRLGARVMRRGAQNRWAVQAMILAAPVVLCGFIWLSSL